MILLYNIIEIPNESAATASAEFSSPLQFIDHLRIRRIPVDVKDPVDEGNLAIVTSSERSACRTCITLRREQKIDGYAVVPWRDTKS
jgi:hypothetical protein